VGTVGRRQIILNVGGEYLNARSYRDCNFSKKYKVKSISYNKSQVFYCDHSAHLLTEVPFAVERSFGSSPGLMAPGDR
jgi:hypothetical protein